MFKSIFKFFKKKEPLIPIDAKNIHCFSIKENQVYIGFHIANGNFHFVQIPIRK